MMITLYDDNDGNYDGDDYDYGGDVYDDDYDCYNHYHGDSDYDGD